MGINEAIQDIVNGIEAGRVFDSHFIVQQLHKKHSDEYIRFTAQYATGNNPTLTSHQMIGHEIKKLEGVERQDFDCWSENIHGVGSKCAGWRRKQD